jgi:signal transduction histidine kinase
MTALTRAMPDSGPTEPTPSPGRFLFPAQEVILGAMLAALLYLAHDPSERILFFGLAVLQIAEGHIPALRTLWYRMASVVAQLILAFLLIGITGGVNSAYFLVLLLPVVSTATYLGVAGTVVTSIAAIGTYLSFLYFVDWTQYSIGDEEMHILAIRCLLLAVAALLVNGLGRVIRDESARHKAAADQLAVANQQLIAAETTVRRTERLAALGQLTAGLAHELRNPLGSIKGSAELLTTAATSADPIVQELAGIISSEVDRTNLLVTRFLDFSRPLEPHKEMAKLGDVIDKAAKHAGVPIITNFSPEVAMIPLDPTLMQQVFINLLTNARQAGPPDAPITVATRPAGEEAEISVIDRGAGIPADKRESIFNPFVTSRKGGVGLGLAIVARIVDGHGGRMAVESEPGKGSTFRVYLPLQA